MVDVVFGKAMVVIAVLSGVPLLISGLSALLIAIIQAATQIQEQSITYIVKIGTLVVVLFILWPWMSEVTIRMLTDVLVSLPVIGRS